jgi:predicted  nucleic acid-binding Zn-ribbon protein
VSELRQELEVKTREIARLREDQARSEQRLTDAEERAARAETQLAALSAKVTLHALFLPHPLFHHGSVAL